MINQNIILKILTTKNNTFITFLDINHILLYKQSIGKKITQDFKALLLTALTTGLSKIKNTISINESKKEQESLLNTPKDLSVDLKKEQESLLNINIVPTTNGNKEEETSLNINLYLYFKNFPKIYISDILNLFVI